MEISDKHKMFVDEYTANGFNGTRAYMKIYPDASYDAARGSASDLLANPNIQELVKIAKAELKDRVMITKEEILQDLWDIKNANKNDKISYSLKSIEIINKMLGYNEPEVIISNDTSKDFKITIVKPKDNNGD